MSHVCKVGFENRKHHIDEELSVLSVPQKHLTLPVFPACASLLQLWWWKLNLGRFSYFESPQYELTRGRDMWEGGYTVYARGEKKWKKGLCFEYPL